MYADNLDFTCKLESKNPVYIKAYTISRCVNQCGKNFADCSCSKSCLHNGSCCSDYRFCQVIEENHIANSKIPNCQYADEEDSICLQCKENFYYFNNNCYLKCPVLASSSPSANSNNNLLIFDSNYNTKKQKNLKDAEIESIVKGKDHRSFNDNGVNNLNMTMMIDNKIIIKSKATSLIVAPYEENKICKEISLGIAYNNNFYYSVFKFFIILLFKKNHKIFFS